MNQFLSFVVVTTTLLLPSGDLQAASPEVDITFYQDVAWSPDSKTLATSAMRIPRSLWEKEQFGALEKSRFDIHLIPIDGSSPVRITDNPENELWPTWWPGGCCVLYAAQWSESSALQFVKIDGSDPQSMKGLPGRISQPSVSPDGKKIAFNSDEGEESHIYVISKEGGGQAPIKLTSTGPNNWNPVWSPDGTKILFFSSRQGKGQDQIFVVNADGAGETQLTQDTFNNVFPSWSPDGRRIVFGSNREGKGKEGIFVMDADGSNIRRLIPSMPAEFARWSPDGKSLAFVSGEFPDTQIYIAGGDGSNLTQVTR
jgi:Tol biopolymer transport system component